MPHIKSLNIGIDFDREMRRRRISSRLKQRLDEGMIDEVQKLLDSGLTPEQLIYYGLEYKYLTLHLTGELSFEEMFRQLEIAIHQFAKRQMTWFRGMEKRGTKIHWINGHLPMEEKIEQILMLAGVGLS
jgi:tRNA dimethylallyltransferase